jgi:CRP-like cAMP-binding protein
LLVDDDTAARADLLRQALGPVLRGDEGLLRRLADGSTSRRYAAGEVVFEKGSAALALYVVASGAVSIFDSVRGHDVEIAVIRPGDFFGELAYALDIPRTRAARAAEDSELLEIPDALLDKAIAEDRGVATRLMDEFEARMPGREGSVE